MDIVVRRLNEEYRARPLVAGSSSPSRRRCLAVDKPKNQFLPNAIVKTGSATSLTVTADAKDTTFAVDAKTKVHGKGIGTKSKAKGGKPTISIC